MYKEIKERESHTVPGHVVGHLTSAGFKLSCNFFLQNTVQYASLVCFMKKKVRYVIPSAGAMPSMLNLKV